MSEEKKNHAERKSSVNLVTKVGTLIHNQSTYQKRRLNLLLQFFLADLNLFVIIEYENV